MFGNNKATLVIIVLQCQIYSEQSSMCLQAAQTPPGQC